MPTTGVEPWTPVDSLAWLKAMAWDLRGNYDDEIDRARLSGVDRRPSGSTQLYPAYPLRTATQPILSDDGPRARPPTGSAPAAAAAPRGPAAPSEQARARR